EVQAMQFIKEHTTIPVPDIYSYRIDGSDSIIEMERIAGITLKECIAQNRVTTDHIQRIAEQLNDYIHQMRGLQSDVVGPCIWTDSDTEQALHDPFVPFPTPMPMHEAEAFMMNNLLQHRESRPPTGFTQMFSKYLKQHTYTINLTHGDLLPRNIMVDPDTCQITGILDWEFSGFYPEYWEYSR
ncbi:kinase-like domain-containing protein, partial [Dimargaris cristalligena]